MAKKYIYEIHKFADVYKSKISKEAANFFTLQCDSTYQDKTLNEDLISFSQIEENPYLGRLSQDAADEVKGIMEEMDKKGCAYLRIL